MEGYCSLVKLPQNLFQFCDNMIHFFAGIIPGKREPDRDAFRVFVEGRDDMRATGRTTAAGTPTGNTNAFQVECK